MIPLSKLGGMYEIVFANNALVINGNPSIDYDFVVQGFSATSSGTSSTVGYSINYSMSDMTTGILYRVRDTSLLYFDSAFLLTDTSVFLSNDPWELARGPYSLDEYFVFTLLSGDYAFCHGTLNDTTYATTKGKVSYLTRMYLACQVQDDGTTKFDSIPQYPWGTVAIRPPVLRTLRSSVVPLYHVDGTPVVGNEGQTVRVGRK